MIDANTTATTNELCSLVGFTKQHLGALERDGVIARAGRDAWLLMETVRRLFDHARARNEATASSRQRFEAARAEREELKLADTKRRLHDDMVKESLEHCAAMAQSFVADLTALPARHHRDLAERKRLTEAIEDLRRKFAARLRKQMEAA